MAKSDYSVLFTSVGRRVEFIEQVHQALHQQLNVISADAQFDAPALKLSTKGAVLPTVTTADFPGRLLDLCQAEQVSHVFPLIDTELPIYASIKKEMSLFGINLVVSDSETIQLSHDKYSFGVFLGEKNILTPRIFNPEDSLDLFSFYCVRQRFGSRSVGMRKVAGKEAQILLKRRDLVITEWISGTEYSIDILVDEAQPKIVVPRQRNLIRDGESIIGTTENDVSIIDLAKKVVQHFPGLYGPVCLQLIKNENGLFITELNARFGGGITLSNMAGAGFIEWIASQVLKKEFVAPKWESGKKMYRYLKGFYS